MIMHQSFRDDLVEHIKAEPEKTFVAMGIGRDKLLEDTDKIERLWALYQKSIEEYGVDAAYAYGDAMRDVFGIMVDGFEG